MAFPNCFILKRLIYKLMAIFSYFWTLHLKYLKYFLELVKKWFWYHLEDSRLNVMTNRVCRISMLNLKSILNRNSATLLMILECKPTPSSALYLIRFLHWHMRKLHSNFTQPLAESIVYVVGFEEWKRVVSRLHTHCGQF